jgi:NAD(P)-dependent dehydrogenase (short-subunit alcohol dehydrogenase family)
VLVSQKHALTRVEAKEGTMRFTDKAALITVFANGRATAEIMAREGAVVVGVDNRPGRLDEAVAALRGRRQGTWAALRRALRWHWTG